MLARARVNPGSDDAMNFAAPTAGLLLETTEAET
jgi:hypothetical protein